jgi:hypothetical protein
MKNRLPFLNAGRRVTLSCYAALPGTGPHSAVCADCALLQRNNSALTCSGYAKLMGRAGSPINSGTAACRYFKLRNPKVH